MQVKKYTKRIGEGCKEGVNEVLGHTQQMELYLNTPWSAAWAWWLCYFLRSIHKTRISHTIYVWGQICIPIMSIAKQTVHNMLFSLQLLMWNMGARLALISLDLPLLVTPLHSLNGPNSAHCIGRIWKPHFSPLTEHLLTHVCMRDVNLKWDVVTKRNGSHYWTVG